MMMAPTMPTMRRGGGSRGYDTTSYIVGLGGADIRRQACDMCRKKKIKCDGKMPKCSHCINYKTECVFTQVEKKRNPPKGYVPSIVLSTANLTPVQGQVYRRLGEQTG